MLLVAYDICDPRRLQRVAKIMLDYGHRVQKSIFEAHVTPKRYQNMRLRVEREMDLEEDSVKYIPLCEKCSVSVEIIGWGTYTDDESGHELL